MGHVETDRKQVFGSEELTDEYMNKIQDIFEQRMREMTRAIDNTVTAPLTNWVN